METAMLPPAQSRVDSFINGVLSEGELSNAFHGYNIPTEEEQKRANDKIKSDFRKLCESLSEEELIPALDQYVKRVSSVEIPHKTALLFNLLRFGVTNRCVSPRLVCETLLKCESLVYRNKDFWSKSFLIIDQIMPSVDYKGVRDLLKKIFEKAHAIKSADNVSFMDFQFIQQVIKRIFDRNVPLLPSYLILDELQKKLPANRNYPHWKLSRLISSFIDSFRPAAQMVSISVLKEIIGGDNIYGRSKLLPVVGHSSTLGNVWKLDPVTVKAPLIGSLPYNKELHEPQPLLLRYVLEQSYSREFLCNMLGVSEEQKQRCPVLEEQLVELLVGAMHKSESGLDKAEDGQSLWQHLSSQLIYFVLFQFASFPNIINILYSKLKGRNLFKGRDHLMWVLLQFISGSIQENQLSDFWPVMKLHDLLFPEKEPLPIPDVSKASATHAFAATCIWIHLMKKAHLENVTLTRNLPNALTSHLEFLQSSVNDADLVHTLHTDYRVSLLCNAYSTNQDYFARPMGVLVEAVHGTPKQSSNSICPTIPLSMAILDSLTMHTKMSLIHNIVCLAKSKCSTDANAQPKLAQSTHGLSPALLETYSRLLVYSEIESLGIESIITHLLPVVLRSHAWSILYTLLEMFSYRLHHFQPRYRVQLLIRLHSLASVPQTNQVQLHLCVESTALKLIAGFASSEVQPQLSMLPSEPKTLLSYDSEELNKVLVLTIARAIHITGSKFFSGSWCTNILTAIMQLTPHSWSSFTLQYFPRILADFFKSHQVPNESKEQLRRSVEEEYRKWKTMSNENDMILHFSHQGSSSLFLCLLWKMLLDQDRISTIAYEILDRIGARSLSTHLRTLADFLVFEFSISAVGEHVNKYIDALNDLIWKCHVIQLDRLILSLTLRSFEENEAQVCFFIIHMLLLKSQEFKNRVYDFVKNNSPEHWKQSDWHDKHLMFQRAFEEKFYFDNKKNSQHTYLPAYFGNICLRFLPVMDIVIHRFIELPPSNMPEQLIDSFGCLYKFHDRPLTYLYNTLHYYEQKLQESPLLKKKLVATIIGSLKDIRPEGWALSDDYLSFTNSNDLAWSPDQDYYVKLIERFVKTLAGKSPFPHTDWRFNEFPNQGAHALHVTCIELMGLPISTQSVGNALLDIILKGRPNIVYLNIVPWMNAVGLLLTALPGAYWNILNDRILETIQSTLLMNPSLEMDPFVMFDFAGTYNSRIEIPCSYVIALTHSVWYHASPGQICTLPQLLKERFKPVVKTEEQFIFICHLVSPFLQRFCRDETMKIIVELYEMLEAVDKNCRQLEYIDVVCDLLYHIKYMFLIEPPDSIKNEIDKSISNMRSEFQIRLKFITL